MSRPGLADLVPAWFRDDTVQLLLLLLLALLAALGSIASFVFGAGDGPTRLQVGLLILSLFLTWFVAIQSGG